MDTLLQKALAFTQNFQHNLTTSVSRLTATDYIRLTVLICGYALLRPYLIALGARFQAKDHERPVDAAEMASSDAAVPLRRQVEGQVPEDTESEGEGEGRGGVDWGKKARRRQRVLVRKILEAEERKLAAEQADEVDEDIKEFLVDA